MRRLICGGLAALVMPGLSAPLIADEAERDVFTDLAYDQAFERAVNEEKIFFVHGTADWCMPCQMMERNTYPDETLAAWMDEHVIAYKLDVDDEPEQAQELSISAMPTMIFFVGGEEYGRLTGMRSSRQLLDAFESVQRGDELPEDTGSERGRVQRELAGMENRIADDPDEAAGRLIELWRELPEMDRATQRAIRPGLLHYSQLLVTQNPAWQEDFAELRDEAKDRLDRPAVRQWQDLVDWVELNHIIGEDDETFAWLDRIKHDEAAWPTIRRLDDTLRDILIEHDRWSDLYITYDDPPTQIEHELAAMERMQPALERAYSDLEDDERQRMVDEMIDYYRQDVLTQASHMYVACLSAGEEEQGRQVVEIVLEHFDATVVLPAVLTKARELYEFREHQLAWLEASDEFEQRDELIDWVNRGLRSAGD